MSDEIDTVKKMVTAYMFIVSKTIQDIVPKYIVYHLVNDVSVSTLRRSMSYMYSVIASSLDLKMTWYILWVCSPIHCFADGDVCQ